MPLIRGRQPPQSSFVVGELKLVAVGVEKFIREIDQAIVETRVARFRDSIPQCHFMRRGKWTCHADLPGGENWNRWRRIRQHLRRAHHHAMAVVAAIATSYPKESLATLRVANMFKGPDACRNDKEREKLWSRHKPVLQRLAILLRQQLKSQEPSKFVANGTADRETLTQPLKKTDSQEPAAPRPLEARNAWAYEQHMAWRKDAAILIELRRIAKENGWQTLTTVNGVRDGNLKYAEKKGLKTRVKKRERKMK